MEGLGGRHESPQKKCLLPLNSQVSDVKIIILLISCISQSFLLLLFAQLLNVSPLRLLPFLSIPSI